MDADTAMFIILSFNYLNTLYSDSQWSHYNRYFEIIPSFAEKKLEKKKKYIFRFVTALWNKAASKTMCISLRWYSLDYV